MPADLPVLAGFENAYGLDVCDVGEDGAVVILGHHSDDPLRIIAALNLHAREFWGLTNLLDKSHAQLSDLADSLIEAWATVRIDRPAMPSAEWYMEWGHASTDPDTFPITLWRP